MTSSVAPIEPVSDLRPDRTEGVEALGPAPLPVGLLQVAAGDVVDADVATDAPLRLLDVGIAQPRADHDADLRLELDLPRDGRQHDRIAGADERASVA